MFLIIKHNEIIAECRSRVNVIKWYETYQDENVYVIKGDLIKDFIKKAI